MINVELDEVGGYMNLEGRMFIKCTIRNIMDKIIVSNQGVYESSFAKLKHFVT